MKSVFQEHADLIDVFSRNFSVPPREEPDLWAAKHVKLNSDVSEYYDPPSSPYFVRPFRRIFDNTRKEICIVAPPGTGKTTLFEAAVCYIAVNDPGDVLIASQVDELLKQWLDSRLNPILARCDALADYLPRTSDRQKKLLLLKHMFIAARAANESGLQQISVRWAFGDEVWLWAKGLVGYLRKRLHDRWNGRTVLVSQAGYAGTDWETACLEGDQYHYHWQCEACYTQQPFDFDVNVKWEGDEDKAKIDWERVRNTTRLVCPHCLTAYGDTPETRRRLSTAAQWIRTAPGEDSTHETYWIPALANFRVSWFTLVREFLSARRAWKLGDREPWFQFVTQRQSRFWKDEMEKDESHLQTSLYSLKSFAAGQRIEDEAVRFMTVDVQKDHYWVVIRAWKFGGESRLINFAHVMTEQELRTMQQVYGVEDRFVFIDSGYESSRIYTICSKYGWMATLGTGEHAFEHPLKDARRRVTGKTYKLFSRIRDVAVGQVRAKLILLASERLKDICAHCRDGKSLRWEVPADVPAIYLNQVNGEVKRESIEPSTKRSIFKWVQAGPNHAWDCEYMQIAAALISTVLRLD